MPLEIYPTQVGFFNELGINNTSLYLNLGPEARIDRNLYLIPYAGLAIIPFSKYKNEDLAVLYYLGISAGYYINLDDQSEINIELASDLIKLNVNEVNIYFKIGITFNLLYSL
jgi:hypothetical protein